MICGNIVGGSSGFGKTYVIEDMDGNTYTGVVVEDITVFTAKDEDVLEGKVYAGENGVSTGTLKV